MAYTLERHTIADVDTIEEALRRAATTGRGIRLIDRNLNERLFSYADLHDAANRAATALRERGVDTGDRVCLLSTTTPELLVSLFGAWAAGAVPVVMPLPRRQSELEAFIEDVRIRVETAEASLVGLSSFILDQLPAGDLTTVPVASLEDLASGEHAPIRSTPNDPDALAFLQFTSGTTARPRAVALTHRQILANMGAAGAFLEVEPDRDVIVSWLPLFHDMGLIGLVIGTTTFGAELVLEPTEEFLGRPGSWLDAISAYGGTITAAPNFGYGLAARDIIARPRDLDLTSWRVAVNGAEPIDRGTLDRFTEATAPYGVRPEVMCPMFGLAEATLAVTGSRPSESVRVEWVDREALESEARVLPSSPEDPEAKALVVCGQPVPGVDVAIADPEEGSPLPEGRVGEICVRSPSIMSGYWRDPQATAEAIRGEWLHTGDLGYMSPNGLVVCGRMKDMIILGGRNYYPEDYEFWAEHVDGVRKGNVIAFAVPERERMIVVAETTAAPEDARGVADEVMRTLRRRLGRGPEEVVLIAPGTLPKTSSGKRQRRACRDRYASGQLATVASAVR